MFFIEIPFVLLILFGLCIVAFGWGIISNIGEILTNIGIGILVLIVVLVILILLNKICCFIGRKRMFPTAILFMASLSLFGYGIYTYYNYHYNRYDAFYTINEVSVQGKTENGESLVCVVPGGSLVSEVDRNTELKVYMGGMDSIPKTRECKYTNENGTEVIVEIEKSNMTKCGWLDCFDKLHEE